MIRTGLFYLALLVAFCALTVVGVLGLGGAL
jgi:hypothetical protein